VSCRRSWQGDRHSLEQNDGRWEREHENIGSVWSAYLYQENSTETTEDGAGLVVDRMDADNMDRGTEGDEDHSGNWLKEVEAVAHVEGKLGVEEGDGWDREN